MRAMRRAVTAAALLAVSAGCARGADVKVAVVNMERVLKASEEMVSARSTMDQKIEEYKAEKVRMLAELDTLKQEAEGAQEQAENKALSAEVREVKRELAREKIIRLGERERDINRTLRDRRKELSDREQALLQEIVAKYQEVVQAYAKREGFDLVLDASAQGLNGIEAVLYYGNALDITPAILKQIGAKEPEGAESRESNSGADRGSAAGDGGR